MIHTLDLALLIGAAVLLVAVGAVRLSTRVGVPSLLVYLALGVILGGSVLGIEFDDVELTRVLGVCALILIIAEGGLSARWPTLRPVLAPAATLATVGMLVSVALVGLAVHLMLRVAWPLAFLYGAVLSSTDAAAIFSTLRRMPLKPRLAATLEAESGMNDAPAVLLVIAFSVAPDGPWGPGGPWWQQGLLMGYGLLAGAAVGVAVGWLGGHGLRRAALPAAGLYPLAVVALTVLAYAVGALVDASGFMAVYAAGVILGNLHIPHRPAVLGFADGLAWLAQIGLFVLLGLLVTPVKLPAAVLPALVVGGVLTLLARPVSVFVSLVWFRLGWRDYAFLSWAGLRGAVPIVLTTIPLGLGVAGASGLFDAVFVLVVIFTVVQAGLLPQVARWLRVTAPAEPTELIVETAPLDQMDADLLQLRIPIGSHLAGVHVDELRLPTGAQITLVLRGGRGFVPGLDTRLRAGDDLLIVATQECRELTERRLRAVSRRGRLARWLGEGGALEPRRGSEERVGPAK